MLIDPKEKKEINSTLSSIKRVMKTSLNNLWRNKLVSFAAIVLIALIIFIFNIIIAINTMANEVINKVNTKIDIIAYIKDDADFLEIDNMIEELRSFPEVKEVKYTTKEQALEEIIKEMPDQTNPFKKTDLENVLPASIQIITFSPKDHLKIISFLYEGKYSYILKNVNNNSANQKVSAQLMNITDWSKKILFSIIITFAVGGFLIIINAVYLTIHSRREEINIMKLVGASYFYIKAPFIIEGIIYGLLAVILSILLLLIFIEKTHLVELGLPLIKGNPYELILIELFTGTILGIIASVIAVERYMMKDK